jgi:hypothetical protein
MARIEIETVVVRRLVVESGATTGLLRPDWTPDLLDGGLQRAALKGEPRPGRAAVAAGAVIALAGITIQEVARRRLGRSALPALPSPTRLAAWAGRTQPSLPAEFRHVKG